MTQRYINRRRSGVRRRRRHVIGRRERVGSDTVMLVERTGARVWRRRRRKRQTIRQESVVDRRQTRSTGRIASGACSTVLTCRRAVAPRRQRNRPLLASTLWMCRWHGVGRIRFLTKVKTTSTGLCRVSGGRCVGDVTFQVERVDVCEWASLPTLVVALQRRLALPLRDGRR